MPPLPGLRVVRSPIHGYGVVAARAFATGEVIAHVDGIAWRPHEAVDDRYSLWIDDNLYLDMLDQTRWINHCCDPNSEVEADVDENGQAWARFVALRPIAAGEELTYDYGFPAHLAEPCACGSSVCRGWIVDVEEMPRLVKRRRQAR